MRIADMTRRRWSLRVIAIRLARPTLSLVRRRVRRPSPLLLTIAGWPRRGRTSWTSSGRRARDWRAVRRRRHPRLDRWHGSIVLDDAIELGEIGVRRSQPSVELAVQSVEPEVAHGLRKVLGVLEREKVGDQERDRGRAQLKFADDAREVGAKPLDVHSGEDLAVRQLTRR